MNRLLLIVFATLVSAPVWAGPNTPDPARLKLKSANVVVVDADTDRQIYAKAANEVTPIASLTKLMTAMVVLDAQQPMDDPLTIDTDDIDTLKGSSSRLRMGATLSRREMLRLALMASENRAASALARYYPGGKAAAVEAMNAKATLLGLAQTHYADPTGLSPENVSTAHDLAKLVQAAAEYPLIREFTTTPKLSVDIEPTGRTVGFVNTNELVRGQSWDILMQKTGYIREAGRCVVMLVNIASRPIVIVLLDSMGRYTRFADAQRVRYWLETGETLVFARAPHARAVKARVASRGHRAKRARYVKTANR